MLVLLCQPGLVLGELLGLGEQLHHGDHDAGLGLGGNNDNVGVYLDTFSAVSYFRLENLPVEMTEPQLLVWVTIVCTMDLLVVTLTETQWYSIIVASHNCLHVGRG